MAGNLYDLTTLLSVLRVQKQSELFFLPNFFPQQLNFDTEDIAFDKVMSDDRKLAPFVVPNVQGRVLGITGYTTKSFKPAYVKPKHVVDPNMVLPRQPGEALGTGSLSIDQRRNAVIGELTRQHRVIIDNRCEWMAAQALQFGQVVIAGEDYPSTLVDFGRDPSLTITLAGAAAWSSPTSNPLANLKTARVLANQKSGARITQHIFGQNAWDKFAARVDLRDMMDKRYGGQDTRVTLMTDGYDGVEYVGRIVGLDGKGTIDAYVHTGKYIDPDTGNEAFYMNQNGVLGVSATGVQGFRCFGAIKDFDANFQPLPLFMKNWRNQDPSVEYLLSQSAPLMVPKQPDATFYIDVGPD